MELKELETLKMSGEDWNDLTNGEKAWLIGQIMMYMNNEEAYYGDFLYIWPDGESWESCMEDFKSDESYKDLEESFKDNYKAYHEDGLYSHRDIPRSIIKAAHFWDEQLGLKPIVVLK